MEIVQFVLEIVKFVLDVACILWDHTACQTTYITDQEQTLTTLRTKMEELIAIRDDLKLKVQFEEQQGHEPSKQFEGLLKRVEETEIKVNKILSEHEDITKNGSNCPRMCRCRSSYKLGKQSANLLNIIQELIDRWGSSEVAFQHPTRDTEGWCEMPMGTQNLLGIEFHLEKVRKGLKDDNVGIIGLYGMGGVGKTTFLKKINNELPKSGDGAFDWVLWVVASREATIETIQKNIMGKFKIPYETINNSVDEVRNEIYKTLTNKKYLLMLDDVWKMLDLFEKVGIPKPNSQNRSKIIFTTRAKDVCSQMEAQIIIKFDCLPWKEAWSLFREKVGEAIMSSQIESYAIKIAKECKGLPLALITIGRAMSGKEDPREWSHALDQLKNFPAEIPSLEEEVYRKLQFSYDYLADSTKQKCFLFCSLFPEDYIIQSDNLIDLWMGEGYLNKASTIAKARDYGFSIIADLKRACLLENGSQSYYFESVKMHDMFRDMALRIATKKSFVLEKGELRRFKTNIHDWNEDIEKISLWGKKSLMYKRKEENASEKDQEKFILTREFPKLCTLLYKFSPSVSLSGLFNLIPKVKVLDLSGNPDIEYLPEGISKMENLEYFDVSKTRIRRFHTEMKSLSKLRHLLMDDVSEVLGLTEIMSSLTELLVFRKNYDPYSVELLSVLEKLQNIKEIGVCLNSAESMNFFQKLRKLQLCSTRMVLSKRSGVREWCLTNMRNLESLLISSSDLNAVKCTNPRTLTVFNRLRDVRVRFCDNLVELDFLGYAPSLKNLKVKACKSLQRILCIEETDQMFLSLKTLHLEDLPCLEIICNKPLSFPVLEIIEIQECPKLKQNPLIDVKPTTSNIREIMGDQIWWNSLQWRDDLLKNHFSQFFGHITNYQLFIKLEESHQDKML